MDNFVKKIQATPGHKIRSWYLLGVILNLSDENLRSFLYESTPGQSVGVIPKALSIARVLYVGYGQGCWDILREPGKLQPR